MDQSYAYNGADARVGLSGTGGPRTYRRDGVGVTAPVLSDGVSTMVPGISERSNNVTRFSHLDRLGTNSRTTDASGNVIDQKSYDAFGLPTSFNNPSGSQKGFASGYGVQEDGETGLKLMGHRYYDPGTGRFGEGLTKSPPEVCGAWPLVSSRLPRALVFPTGLPPLPTCRNVNHPGTRVGPKNHPKAPKPCDKNAGGGREP